MGQAAHPSVYLHGFAGGPALWDDLFAALDARGVVAASASRQTLALPFHGAAPASSFFAAAEALWEKIASTRPPVHLVGYSMGARLALAMACHQPERVSALTLIGVHPGLDDAGARRARARQDAVWQTLLRQQGMAAFAQAWGDQPLFARLRHVCSAARLAQLRAERLALSAQRLAQSFDVLGLAAMPALGALARTLPMPVHLIVGALDTKFVAIAQALAPTLREGRITLIPAAGHSVPLEAPIALAACLHAQARTTPPARPR